MFYTGTPDFGDSEQATKDQTGEPETITLAVLAPLPTWVAWQTEDRKDGKPTKVPYSPFGRKARADAPKTWGTRAQAEAQAAKLPKPYGAGGVGLEFYPLADGRSYGGVDLDTCCNPQTGTLEKWADDVVKRFASYTETSPSGTGVKIFFLYTTADLDRLRKAMGGAKWGKQFKREGGDHPPAIELHFGNRFFAVTDASLAGGTADFRHVETDLLLDLIQVVGPAFGRADKSTSDDAGSGKTGRGRSGEGRKKERTSTDRSRSAVAFRKGRELRRNGATFEEMVEALLADAETCEWTQEKGQANSQRELHRIWDKAAPRGTVIRINAGELHLSTTAAETAFIASGLPIFQRGNSLVRPVTREVSASRGRTTIAAGLGEMNVHSMIDLMCETAEYEKYDGRAGEWVRINPPGQVANILLQRQGKWRLPVIAGVITTPTLRPNGTLLTEPGYDQTTRLYHAADQSLKLDPGVHAPTRSLAEAALSELEKLLLEFAFVKLVRAGEPDLEVSKAVALSGLITPVVRGAMSVAPLHAANAHAPGSGKSYLVDLVSAISTGRPCPVICAAPDEAETEKRIAGLLLAGYPIVSIDNCNGELGGDFICQAVERPLIRIRPLGESDIIEIESSVTMFATGNNLRVRGDMVRRALVAELDPQMERPELREFAHDPVQTVLNDRGRYVSACLIIVRAYILADYPGKLPALASYEDWSGLVRSALVWLGCADPVISMEAAREDDPELTELREMLVVWDASFGSDTKTTAQVVAAIDEQKQSQMGEPTDYVHSELREMLTRLFGERGAVNTRRMGKWLAAKEGRMVGNRRFKRDHTSGQNGVAKWCVATTR